MKPETKDTLIFWGIMIIMAIATVIGMIVWGFSRTWRFFFRRKTI